MSNEPTVNSGGGNKLLARLDKEFGFSREEVEIKKQQELATTSTKSKTDEMIDADFGFTRDTLKSLISTAEQAVDDFKGIAEETQEPAMYDTLATLLKTAGDLTKTMMQNAKTKKSLEVDSAIAQQTQASTVTNSQTNIYVGTLADLLSTPTTTEATVEDENSGMLIDGVDIYEDADKQ